MADYFNNDLEYIVEEDFFDLGEFDNFDDEFEQDDQQGDGNDSEVENIDNLAKQKNDTSAADYRNGKDMQGIPWERLNHTRDEYREMRLKMYKNYENLSGPRHGLDKECKQVERASTFYDFHYNTRLVKSTIVHFQVLNVAGKVIPTRKHRGSSPRQLSRVQISTMSVKGNLMVAGGFQGELICKGMQRANF